MRRKLLRPVLAGFLGLLFAFVLAEIVIRLAGSHHFGDKKIEPRSDGEFRIACLGNSHTYGFGVPKGKAYPDVLNEFLRNERPGFPVRVINHGMGNSNTYNVLKRAEEVMPSEKPNVVLMMVGQPNFWNKEGYEDFLIESEGYNPHATSSIAKFFSKSRIIRWFLMLQYEKRMKEITPEEGLAREAYQILGKHFFLMSSQNVHPEEAKRMKDVLTEFLGKNKTHPPMAMREFLVTLARLEWIHYHNYQKAIDHLEESFRIHPIKENPLTAVAAIVLLHSAKDRSAVKRLTGIRDEIFKVFPPEQRKKYIDLFVSNNHKIQENPELIPFHDETRKLIPAATYLHINLAEYFKSKGDLKKAVEIASELVKANPLQQQSSRAYSYFSLEAISTYPEEVKKMAMDTREEFLKRFSSEAYLMEGGEDGKMEAWIIRDIGKIAGTARRGNAEVVLQGYHWLRDIYHRDQLSAIVAKAAKEHRLRYLEQAGTFRGELGNDEDSFYINAPGLPPRDTHPSEKGHRLIARMIYDYLNREKLLPPELRDLDGRKLYRYSHEK